MVGRAAGLQLCVQGGRRSSTTTSRANFVAPMRGSLCVSARERTRHACARVSGGCVRKVWLERQVCKPGAETWQPTAPRPTARNIAGTPCVCACVRGVGWWCHPAPVGVTQSHAAAPARCSACAGRPHLMPGDWHMVVNARSRLPSTQRLPSTHGGSACDPSSEPRRGCAPAPPSSTRPSYAITQAASRRGGAAASWTGVANNPRITGRCQHDDANYATRVVACFCIHSSLSKAKPSLQVPPASRSGSC
jgi:hypothetical protein